MSLQNILLMTLSCILKFCTVDDIDTLQFSLDDLAIWASSWQLSIAINKCCTMDIKTNKRADKFYENRIEEREIENVLKVKDLGVYFESNLSFKSQINHVVSTAKQRTFLLFRCFLSKDMNVGLQILHLTNIKLLLTCLVSKFCR